MARQQDVFIEVVSPGVFDEHHKELGGLLQTCVLAGASIHFILPFTLDDSLAFWAEKVRPAMNCGGRTLWIAREEQRLVGSVQLNCDMPPNQMHRADVMKLLVHPDYRRRGIARRLMAALEDHARAVGRSLITLDTATGDSAEHLYLSMGYISAGVIPHFARDVTEARYVPATLMYKLL